MVVMKSLVIRNGGSPVVVIRSHMPTALGKVIPSTIDCGILPPLFITAFTHHKAITTHSVDFWFISVKKINKKVMENPLIGTKRE